MSKTPVCVCADRYTHECNCLNLQADNKWAIVPWFHTHTDLRSAPHPTLNTHTRRLESVSFLFPPDRPVIPFWLNHKVTQRIFQHETKHTHTCLREPPSVPAEAHTWESFTGQITMRFKFLPISWSPKTPGINVLIRSLCCALTGWIMLVLDLQ